MIWSLNFAFSAGASVSVFKLGPRGHYKKREIQKFKRIVMFSAEVKQGN